MKKCLVIVDMLNDFVAESGALKVEGAEALIPNINILKEKFDNVIFVNDNHAKDDPEFEAFPPHCVENTEGADIYNGIVVDKSDVVFTKVKLSCFTNPEVHKYLLKERVDEIVVVGVATEFCVRGAVLDALNLGLKVTIVVDAIAGCDLTQGDQFKVLIEMGKAGAYAVHTCDIVGGKKWGI